MKKKSTVTGRLVAIALTATLSGLTAFAQTIDVRSTRISLKDADVAAQTLSGSREALPATNRNRSTVAARFPTIVLGSASYTMTARSTISIQNDSGEPRITAVDLLPAAFNGDSLANLPENFPGEPTGAGPVGEGFLPGTVSTDGLRFSVPLTSPLVGVAGPGSSPGVAGPGAVRTQGAVIPTGGMRSVGAPSTGSLMGRR